MPDSSRHRSSISLTTAPGTMSSILFAKHVSFEHSVSSPYPVFTSRREEKNNKANVFQHLIDSHSQSDSSCPISQHFAAGAVGGGPAAASFLASESTGTVLIPRLMTRIAGHEKTCSCVGDLEDKTKTMRSRHGVQTPAKMGDSSKVKHRSCLSLMIRQQSEPQFVSIRDASV